VSDVLFQLVTPHADSSELRVASIRGQERINAPYRFELSCHVSLDGGRLATIEADMPGTRASLSLAMGTRWVHGVVTSVALVGALDRGGAEVRLTLEPRLALLDMNVDFRIWQDMTVPEVATELLERWGIEHELRLQGTYRKRTYLTQHRETDLAFFRRILAREGLFFTFAHEGVDGQPGRERVLLLDEAPQSPEVGAVRYATDSGALRDPTRNDEISQFERMRRVRTQRVLRGDYDHRNPGLPQLSKGETPSPAPAGVSAEQLRRRHHRLDAEVEGSPPDTATAQTEARRLLEGERSDAHEARGEGNARSLQPGHRFSLEGHPLGHLNGGYCITEVDHEGHVAELTVSAEDSYRNRFRCIPEAVPPRPRPPTHPRREGTETATVVGVGDEDIATDAQGRVRVRFHWDLAEAAPERRSCWIRVAQPWAGTHFGLQFIPRVGDEVVVSFLGGDPDRPVITGSLYNGTHPTPFDLPDEKATSGLRTQSTPGGDGFNELSFRDTAGDERIYLHAERDLLADVGKDHTVTVKGHQRLQALGHQALVATLGQSMQVAGAQIINVAGDRQVTAAGSSLQSVTGNADIAVGGQRTVRVEGRERIEIKAASDAIYRDDQVVRVLGHQTTIVGQHDARRAHNLHVEGSSTQHATGAIRLSSDKNVEIAVGDSLLRMTPDAIELSSPNLVLRGETLETRATESMAFEAPEQITLKSEKVMLESASAFLGLGKVAKLKGELVKLNCEDDPVDELESPEPPKLTTIALTDEDGKPLPNRRFVLVLADGTERSGTLDDKGEAELELEQSGEIIFPDVHRPRPA